MIAVAEVLTLFGREVKVGEPVTEEFLLAVKILARDAAALYELRSRPDIVRHELGLCQSRAP